MAPFLPTPLLPTPERTTLGSHRYVFFLLFKTQTSFFYMNIFPPCDSSIFSSRSFITFLRDLFNPPGFFSNDVKYENQIRFSLRCVSSDMQQALALKAPPSSKIHHCRSMEPVLLTAV